MRILSRRTLSACVAVALGASVVMGQDPAPPPGDASMAWQEAAQLEGQGQFAQAAARYAAIAAAAPGDQRAALRLAVCQEQAGNVAEALRGYERIIAADAMAVPAEEAFFRKAQLAGKAGDAAECRRCIDRIKAAFPDSSFVARVAVLDAWRAGQDVAAAGAALAREEEASGLVLQAMQADHARDEAGAMQLLDDVITRYPGTSAALRAFDRKGHILLRNKRRDEANVVFLTILGQVGESAPNARIVQTAQTRLAANFHATGQREKALSMYLDLIEKGVGTAVATRAALQVAGLDVELLHRDWFKRVPIPEERWGQLRAACTRVMDMPNAKPGEKARAHVMLVESFAWQGRPEKTVEEANRFLETYTTEAFRQDIATVRFFVGEDLQRLGRHAEALEHFRWIVRAYPGAAEIWPGMDHLPRTYFRIWESLRKSQAPTEDVKAAAASLMAIFPNSAYSPVVRRFVHSQEESSNGR